MLRWVIDAVHGVHAMLRRHPTQRARFTEQAGYRPGSGGMSTGCQQESGLADKADNGPRDKSDEAS